MRVRTRAGPRLPTVRFRVRVRVRVRVRLGRAFRRAARHGQLNVARPQRDKVRFAVVAHERLVVVADKPHLRGARYT